MKKVFILLAVALMAVSVMAQEYEPKILQSLEFKGYSPMIEGFVKPDGRGICVLNIISTDGDDSNFEHVRIDFSDRRCDSYSYNLIVNGHKRSSCVTTETKIVPTDFLIKIVEHKLTKNDTAYYIIGDGSISVSPRYQMGTDSIVSWDSASDKNVTGYEFKVTKKFFYALQELYKWDVKIERHQWD